MNKFALCLLPLCTFIIPVLAQQENDIKISPPIEAVTVYLNGAEIKHSKEVQVKKGSNKIIFQKLSPYLETQSVQVSVDGDAEVQSVSTQSNYLNAEKLEPRIKQVKDSVTLMNSKITTVTNQIDAYNTEKELLNENKNIGGKQTATSILDIDKAAEFYRQKMLDIDNASSKLSEELVTLNEQLVLLQSQLQDLNYKNNPERMEVVVVANSNAEKNITLHLRYTVHNAGWEPMYDLVSTDIIKPIQLKYKAKVYNNTGIPWENIPLTLSTADPSQSASRPHLSTWTLDYSSYSSGEANDVSVVTGGTPSYTWSFGDQQNAPTQTGTYNVTVTDANSATTTDQLNKEGLLNTVNIGTFKQQTQKTAQPVQFKTVAVSELNATFPIANPYTIPADAKPYMVDIATYTLDATYSYIAVPKLDKSAFLVAKISGWEKLSLMDGPMNVYFNNSYVGQSAINTRFVEDTLELSLGRDNQILVTRTKKEDLGSKKMLGSTRKESFKYEIIVKNNKSDAINIEIQDQIPVALETDINVDADDISGATLDAPSGKLAWKASLKGGDSKTYTLAFSIKYPKNKQVTINRYKTVSCPSF